MPSPSSTQPKSSPTESAFTPVGTNGKGGFGGADFPAPPQHCTVPPESSAQPVRPTPISTAWTQCPSAQATGQVLPQAPQLCALLAGSTHAPSHVCWHGSGPPPAAPGASQRGSSSPGIPAPPPASFGAPAAASLPPPLPPAAGEAPAPPAIAPSSIDTAPPQAATNSARTTPDHRSDDTDIRPEIV